MYWIVFCAFLGLVILAVYQYLKGRRKQKQESDERHARLDVYGEEICKRITSLIQTGVSPSLAEQCSFKHALEMFWRRQGWKPKRVERLVIVFSFEGKKEKFEMIMAQFLRPGIERFHQEHPGHFVRIRPFLREVGEPTKK